MECYSICDINKKEIVKTINADSIVYIEFIPNKSLRIGCENSCVGFYMENDEILVRENCESERDKNFIPSAILENTNIKYESKDKIRELFERFNGEMAKHILTELLESYI
jgi:hypothetical protein